jgi:DNA-directed RNA polymerase specialized sigma24 family protein
MGAIAMDTATLPLDSPPGHWRPCRRPRMHDDLHSALLALRDASDIDAPELFPQWRIVYAAIERCGRVAGAGMSADREDAVNESALKVRRGVRSVKARDAAAAQAWIARIYQNTQRDLARRRQRRREVYDHAAPGGEGRREGLLDRLAAPEPGLDPAKLDSEELQPFEAALFDRVDEHLERDVRPAVRASARRRAEVAYESIVRQRPTGELLEELGGKVSADALYQWVRRGREDVLLPVLEAWILDPAADEAERGFAIALKAILQARQRADAGKPRSGRRKNEKKGGGDP